MIIVLAASLQAQWSNDPNNNLIVGYGLNPDLCSDSAGGCYITYEYGTTGYPRKLGVERLDRYGYKPWGTLKQIPGELPEQWYAEIIEDGEGGVIISYEDDEFIPPFYYRVRIRVQRVDSTGDLLWGQTGVRGTTEELNHGVQRLVSDGNGGCIVVWSNELPNYTYDYRANRINNLGERVWSDTGIFLENSIYNDAAGIVRASDGNYYARIRTSLYRIKENGHIIRQDSVTLGYPVPDSEGGVVLSGRVGNISNRKLVAQRQDSLGNNLWQEPYVEIADSLDMGTSLNILANNNYYHYGWLGRKNNVAEILQIQSLRNDGTKLYLGGSISLSDSPTSVTSIPMISSHNGSNIYAWTHWESPQTYSANFARRIDSTGTDLWQINPVLLNEPYLGYFSMTTDCVGGAIGVGYMNSDFAIRVLKVSVNGNLGEVIIPVELISFNGKLINNSVELYWQTATETNNSGFEIFRGVYLENSGTQNDKDVWKLIGFIEGCGTTTEPKTYSFIDEDVKTGTYKYRLKQIDFDGSFEYSSIVEVAVGIPTEYLLEQNFPNPFNSSTIIKYQIPKVETHRDASLQLVKLIVYDVLGNEVATLVNEEKPAGEYEIEFTATGLSSGIYFYKLEAGNPATGSGQSFIQCKKMILLK